MEKQKGISGYSNITEQIKGVSNQKEIYDNLKDQSLQEITAIVMEIEAEVKDRKSEMEETLTVDSKLKQWSGSKGRVSKSEFEERRTNDSELEQCQDFEGKDCRSELDECRGVDIK